MEIKTLQRRKTYLTDVNVQDSSMKLEKLLSELRKKNIPDAIAENINAGIDRLNDFSSDDKAYVALVNGESSRILTLVGQELRFVVKNHYQNQWMALGMLFAMPFGVMFGLSMDNMAFMAIGLPIGMSIGLALGADKDKKVKESGLQLDLDL